MSAIIWSILATAREAADCERAGACVWGHINGACPYAED